MSFDTLILGIVIGLAALTPTFLRMFRGGRPFIFRVRVANQYRRDCQEGMHPPFSPNVADWRWAQRDREQDLINWRRSSEYNFRRDRHLYEGRQW